MFQSFGLHSLHQQHMTQIGFTSGVVINWLLIRIKGLDPPFPPQLFQEIVLGDTTTKFHTGVTKDLSKIALRVWTPRSRPSYFRR